LDMPGISCGSTNIFFVFLSVIKTVSLIAICS
jgi:hypothetical protein